MREGGRMEQLDSKEGKETHLMTRNLPLGRSTRRMSHRHRAPSVEPR